MASHHQRLGLLAPYAELPGECFDFLASLEPPIMAWQVITESEDTHELSGLEALGGLDRLAAGAQRLARWQPQAVIWACTSGSFILGRAFSEEQARRIEEIAGVPASSTSLAYVEAVQSLGVEEVSIVASYPQPATEAFVGYLREWDIDVRNVASWGAPGARAAELLTPEDVEELIAEFNDGSELILLPDTAVWGIQISQTLRERVNMPILSANQVTLWKGLRMLGVGEVSPFLDDR